MQPVDARSPQHSPSWSCLPRLPVFLCRLRPTRPCSSRSSGPPTAPRCPTRWRSACQDRSPGVPPSTRVRPSRRSPCLVTRTSRSRPQRPAITA